MSPGEFNTRYRWIIEGACECLANHRFACFVVGDYRDAHGNYSNFVAETIRAFAGAGCALYNDAILLTAIGSGSMRARKQFRASRKFVKAHQNVLVFVKGDGKKAAAHCREVNSTTGEHDG